MGLESMAVKLRDYPLLLYLTFILPLALLVLWWLAQASLWYLMFILAWLGAAFVIFFIPIDSEKGSSEQR